MFEYGSIVKILGDLGRFAASFWKTKKDRFEELYFEMKLVLYTRWGHEIRPREVRQWFASLPEKYNKPKYEALKVAIYREMKAKGELEHIFDVPSPHRRRNKTTRN